MSLTWAKNTAGFSLTEDEMKDIPNPAAELGLHVTLKTVQAFTVIGTLVVAPLSAVRDNGRTIPRLATKFGKWGFALGLVTGPVLAYGRMWAMDFDQPGIYDRCYRLRNNRNQVRVDRGSLVGLVAGGALFPLLGSCPILGSLAGLTGGVVAMGLYNHSLLDKHK